MSLQHCPRACHWHSCSCPLLRLQVVLAVQVQQDKEEQTSEVSSPETLSDGPGLKEILKGGEGNQM